MSLGLTKKEQESALFYLKTRVLTIYTQSELSRQTGLSQPSISDTVNERRDVTTKFVLELSRLMEESIRFIVGDSPIASPKRLGQVSGYPEAESKVRHVLTVEDPAQFWIDVRDTVLARQMETVEVTFLFQLATTLQAAWGVKAHSETSYPKNG